MFPFLQDDGTHLLAATDPDRRSAKLLYDPGRFSTKRRPVASQPARPPDFGPTASQKLCESRSSVENRPSCFLQRFTRDFKFGSRNDKTWCWTTLESDVGQPRGMIHSLVFICGYSPQIRSQRRTLSRSCVWPSPTTPPNKGSRTSPGSIHRSMACMYSTISFPTGPSSTLVFGLCDVHLSLRLPPFPPPRPAPPSKL